VKSEIWKYAEKVAESESDNLTGLSSKTLVDFSHQGKIVVFKRIDTEKSCKRVARGSSKGQGIRQLWGAKIAFSLYMDE